MVLVLFSVIASFGYLYPLMFLILALVYFAMMFTGHLLLKKPDDWHEPTDASEKKSIISVIKTKPVLDKFLG